MEPTTTGAVQTPESVGAPGAQTTPAAPAAAAQPAAAENPWLADTGDEYSPDPAALLPAEGSQATTQDTTQAQPAQTEAPPAGALKPDTASAQVPDGQGQPATTAPGPVPYERFQEKVREIDTVKQMAEFYQSAYNELVAKVQGGTAPAATEPGATAAPGAVATEPGKLPDGIKGPGEWDNQQEMDAYNRHMATTEAQKVTRSEIAQITPVIQQLNKFAGALEDMLVRSIHKDFDEVTQPVMAELFVTDSEGKVWTDPQGQPKVKNPALLNWLRQSPSPRKALYDYALSKKAPQKITEAVQTTTKQLLTALDTRPKGPTQPKQAGGDVKPTGLDWNTPPEIADKVLQERGLI